MPNPRTIPAPPRLYRKRRSNAANESPVLPLELASASLLSGQAVLLVFNQAINLDGYTPGGMTLHNEEEAETLVDAEIIEIVSETTVSVYFNPVGGETWPKTTLTATGATGIVAANGGGTWAGIGEVELPYNV